MSLSLVELQRWMAGRIRPTASAAPDADAVVNPQRGTPGIERLAVYAGGYLERTRQALAEMYPAIRHVLGEGTFAELAHRYAERYPSQEYNLSLRGRHLPEFLAGDSLAQRLPFAPDLARLERLVSQAFHAFEQPPLDAAALRGVPLEAWAAMRVVFQPSVGLIASAWPILDIWQARTRPRAAIDIDVDHRPQRVFVYRQGLTVRCERVDERQAALLEGLLVGRSLGAACEALGHAGSAQPVPLTDWFLRWRAQGLIVRCE
jgi:hypothetical protein